ELDEFTTAINDFESATAYTNVDTFIKAYEKELGKINDYQKTYECLEQQIQKDSNKLSLELNDQDHLKTTLESLNRDIEDSNNKIDRSEERRVGKERKSRKTRKH